MQQRERRFLNLLIIEENPYLEQSIRNLLQAEVLTQSYLNLHHLYISMHSASDCRESEKWLSRKPEFVIADEESLQPGACADLLNKIHSSNPHCEIIVIAGKDSGYRRPEWMQQLVYIERNEMLMEELALIMKDKFCDQNRKFPAFFSDQYPSIH